MREIDSFGDRIGKWPVLDSLSPERCDRCGIDLAKHDGGEGLLFRCRGCNAVLCVNQVRFSTKQHRKATQEIGVHERFARSPHTRLRVCGVVDVMPEASAVVDG